MIRPFFRPINYVYRMNSKPGYKYDHNWSLTTDEVTKFETWLNKHSKKFHKKGYPPQGAIGVSRYKVVWTQTSIGTYCEGVCMDCLKLWEAEKAKAEDPRKAEKKITKLYNQSHFEIRGIDE